MSGRSTEFRDSDVLKNELLTNDIEQDKEKNLKKIQNIKNNNSNYYYAYYYRIFNFFDFIFHKQ